MELQHLRSTGKATGTQRSEDAGIGSALQWWGMLDEAHDKPPDIQFDGGYTA